MSAEAGDIKNIVAELEAIKVLLAVSPSQTSSSGSDNSEVGEGKEQGAEGEKKPLLDNNKGKDGDKKSLDSDKSSASKGEEKGDKQKPSLLGKVVRGAALLVYAITHPSKAKEVMGHGMKNLDKSPDELEQRKSNLEKDLQKALDDAERKEGEEKGGKENKKEKEGFDNEVAEVKEALNNDGVQPAAEGDKNHSHSLEDAPKSTDKSQTR